MKRLVSVSTGCSKLMNVKFQGDSSKPSRELNGLLAKTGAHFTSERSSRSILQSGQISFIISMDLVLMFD